MSARQWVIVTVWLTLMIFVGAIVQVAFDDPALTGFSVAANGVIGLSLGMQIGSRWVKQPDLSHARAQALRDAATHLPEVGDVLRGMAAREVGGDEC